MSRLLITGARGFVGRALLPPLVEKGRWEIHASTSGPARDLESEGVTWHQADLLDAASVDRLFAAVEPGLLVQLAWCAEHGSYWQDPANFDWLAANLQIARAFARHGGKRCLFTGTSAEYDWSANLPLHEFKSALQPRRLYGASKLACFWALHGFFNQEGISWAWARFFNPFGPNEDRRRLIPKTCLRLLAGERIEFDAATSQRDFLHTRDVASALVATLASCVQGPVNIASGEAVSVREVVSLIAQNLGCEDRVSFAEDEKEGGADMVVADASRLREEVAWLPEATFEVRLQETCAWWRTDGVAPGSR